MEFRRKKRRIIAECQAGIFRYDEIAGRWRARLSTVLRWARQHDPAYRDATEQSAVRHRRQHAGARAA